MTSASQATPKSRKVRAACSIVGQSDVLPMIIPTTGVEDMAMDLAHHRQPVNPQPQISEFRSAPQNPKNPLFPSRLCSSARAPLNSITSHEAAAKFSKLGIQSHTTQPRPETHITPPRVVK